MNSGKNCEVSEILLYIQVNELAWCSVKDAGRKHEILGSETKNIISLGIASSMSFMFTLVLQSPRSQGQYGGAQVYAVYTVGFCHWIRKPLIFSNELAANPGEGNDTPLQYSCLENPMDGGAWWAAAHGVAKSRTQLSDFTLTFHFHALEKEMATHSSVLAWRIPGTGEPGGLPSMESHRVGHTEVT